MKIVIVGGGTSGLVAAALMNNFWKDKVDITLYYNPETQSSLKTICNTNFLKGR